jgi:hypothetical protein
MRVDKGPNSSEFHDTVRSRREVRRRLAEMRWMCDQLVRNHVTMMGAQLNLSSSLVTRSYFV